MYFKVPVKGLKILAISIWFPSGIAQVPLDKELDLGTSPPVGQYFVDNPLNLLLVPYIIECLCVSLWEQHVVIGLMLPQHPDMKCWVYPLSFKLSR